MTNLNDYKTLLDQVSKIARQNHAKMEKMRTDGKFFNIFDILNMQYSEVFTHSAFICELLNPDGTHGMGNRFLKLFLKSIPEMDSLYLDIRYVKVCKEVSISDFGRLDILIESAGKCIVIENKIYASDGENQLKNYATYLSGKYEDYRLLYLSLFGSEASEKSAVDLVYNKDYIAIGYNKIILDWLYQCAVISENKPNVYYSIHQYINIIKGLTNQMTDEECNQELVKLLCSKENIEKTAEILNIRDLLVSKIMQEQVFDKLMGYYKRKGYEVTDDNSIRPIGWKNHNIVWYYPYSHSRFDIGINQINGRKHISMPLKVLNDGYNDDYQFGWKCVTELMTNCVKISDGTTYKEIKKLINSIIDELDERKEELAAKKITM